jgi:hypothetical protein
MGLFDSLDAAFQNYWISQRAAQRRLDQLDALQRGDLKTAAQEEASYNQILSTLVPQKEGGALDYLGRTLATGVASMIPSLSAAGAAKAATSLIPALRPISPLITYLSAAAASYPDIERQEALNYASSNLPAATQRKAISESAVLQTLVEALSPTALLERRIPILSRPLAQPFLEAGEEAAQEAISQKVKLYGTI